MIAALSDVHGPRYIGYLRASINLLRGSELVVLAGDIVDRGKPEHFKLVLSIIREVHSGPVISVFGNEEYDESKEQLKSVSGDVQWLDDSMVVVKVGGVDVAFVGTRGALDKPTRWQERNIPNIREIYSKRVERIGELLREAAERADKVVLVTHYAPLGPTLEGEDPKIWSQMGSRALTRLILKSRVDVVIHGHAHNSVRTQAQLGSARVYNVALPATKSVTRISLVHAGLEAFL